MKTLKKIFKLDKEKFIIPKSVQDTIPIKALWEDGIFLVGKNKYSKCYKFTDINYSVASRDDKEAMFLEYSELLNSFDTLVLLGKGGETKQKISGKDYYYDEVEFVKSLIGKNNN